MEIELLFQAIFIVSLYCALCGTFKNTPVNGNGGNDIFRIVNI